MVLVGNVSNKKFSSKYWWLIDNKLSIHFGEEKFFLFPKAKGLKEIIISSLNVIPISNTKQ